MAELCLKVVSVIPAQAGIQSVACAVRTNHIVAFLNSFSRMGEGQGEGDLKEQHEVSYAIY